MKELEPMRTKLHVLILMTRGMVTVMKGPMTFNVIMMETTAATHVRTSCQMVTCFAQTVHAMTRRR